MVSSIQVEPVSRSDQYKRVMKPLLERKRRARINRCLDELRDLLVSVLQSEGEAVTRLEKADILELTVRHVRRLSQRRRLALPSPGVKHQQECEDVAKFQQGFVAAAQQVQTFLMSTNTLEPSVSTRLISHLKNYATSITPAPLALTTSQTPSTSPVHPVTRPPVHPPTSHLTSVSSRPPLPHLSGHPASAPSSTSPVFLIPSMPQQTQQNRHGNASNCLPPSYQSPVKSKQLSPQQPLIDLSNRQLQPGINLPIIRDVSLQDRKVAPSPFIDVVSTETDLLPMREPPTIKREPPSLGFREFNNIKPETPDRTSTPPGYDVSRITLQLQAKVVTSYGESQLQTRCSQPGDFANSVYALTSHSRSVSPEERSQSPTPQDLSMKKYVSEDGKSSWRPW